MKNAIKHKIIVFANQKGGVGKTTSAVNVAACIAKSGHNVLFIDCDPQGNATSGFGINKKLLSSSVYDIIIGRSSPDDVIIKTKIQNLSIIPSSMNLVGAEIELVDIERREFLLRDNIQKVSERYDYIIIDCPPSLGIITINALNCATALVVPVLCEFFSLEGLSQLTKTIRIIRQTQNPYLELIGVIINMYDGRLNMAVQVMEQIKKYFPDKIINPPIPRNVKVSEAPSHGLPVIEYDKYSKGAIAFGLVSEELIKRTK